MKLYFEAKNIKELCRILKIPKSQAAKVEIRRNLVIAIRNIIEENKWTQAEAAKKVNVGRTVITAIVNGNIQNISTDRLIDIAYNLGLSLQLKVA